MKKGILIILVFAALFSFTSQADAEILVRPYGTIGGTDVDLPGALDWDTTRSGGGLQGAYEIFENFSIGLDLAHIYSYYYEIVYGYNVTYMNFLGFAEYHYNIVMLQAGLGPYIGTGINDDTPFGMMFAGGLDIPIAKSLSVTLMARVDIVFENWYKGDGNTIMPAFMGGLTIRF